MEEGKIRKCSSWPTLTFRNWLNLSNKLRTLFPDVSSCHLSKTCEPYPRHTLTSATKEINEINHFVDVATLQKQHKRRTYFRKRSLRRTAPTSRHSWVQSFHMNGEENQYSRDEGLFSALCHTGVFHFEEILVMITGPVRS